MSRNPLGVPRGVVQLRDYDPEWPRLYSAEVERLQGGERWRGAEFEHVGSTSVPGLCAKPIVDILVGQVAGSRNALPQLISSGYVHRGNLGIPGREFLRAGDPSTHHIHLVEIGSSQWVSMLSFRDQLRSSPQLVRQYAALKRRLASAFVADREAYLAAKATFIESVCRRAALRRSNHLGD